MKVDEMFKKIHAWEQMQSEMCRTIHAELKALCGTDYKIVLDEPVETFGHYEKFSELAVISGVLMSHNADGWCDKPVQPYYANWKEFMCVNCAIERNRYHLEENDHKNDKLMWSL